MRAPTAAVLGRDVPAGTDRTIAPACGCLCTERRFFGVTRVVRARSEAVWSATVQTTGLLSAFDLRQRPLTSVSRRSRYRRSGSVFASASASR